VLGAETSIFTLENTIFKDSKRSAYGIWEQPNMNKKSLSAFDRSSGHILTKISGKAFIILALRESR
jgi:hypothetical protein